MASTVKNGIDHLRKWHRPLKMATTVYEREISVAAVAVVVRSRPRAIPLAMKSMRKSLHGFPFLSYAKSFAYVNNMPWGLVNYEYKGPHCARPLHSTLGRRLG